MPDIYKYDSPKRYTYIPGSTNRGLAIYEDGLIACSFHSSDPLYYKSVNAYDMVRIHLYGETKKKEKEFNKFLLETDKKIAEHKAKEEMEKTGYVFQSEENSLWLGELQWVKGKPVSNSYNVTLIYENDIRIKDKFLFNLFDQRGYTFKNFLWGDSDLKAIREIKDSDYAEMEIFFDMNYSIKGKDMLQNCFMQIMRKKSFHPIKDYLLRLRYDGEIRPCDLFCKIWNTNSLSGYLFGKWLIGSVSRIFKPGCKYDTMFVLQGDQGTGKSSFFKKFGKGWFSDTFENFDGKDAYCQLSGKWIIEVQEMNAYKKSSITRIKAVLSSTSDYYRNPYGRIAEDHPRVCVFVGTTNDDIFLRDDTGSRRFHVVNVGKTKLLNNQMLLKFLNSKELVDQCWAWAVEQYKKGEKAFLNSEQEEQLAKSNEEFTESDSLAGKIEVQLNIPLPADWNKMSQIDHYYWLNPERPHTIFEKNKSGWVEKPDFSGMSGTIQRTEVCIREIGVEFLGLEEKELSRSFSNRIIRILKLLEWAKSGKKSFHFYGKQQLFIRKEQNQDYKE